MDLRLYAVTDRSYLDGIDLIDAVEQAVRGGITIIQLREKEISSREFYELALRVKKVTRRKNIPLIINDRVDIALAVDADGVHIGQEDLPAEVVRRLIGPGKILGVSAGTVEEAIKAQKDGADYLGVGAAYPTPTKPESCAIGIEGIKKIKEAIGIPVVAIGGITRENAYEVMLKTGVDGISSVSAVFAGDVEENSRQLLESINKAIADRS
ncbi:MAG: thiamine-phosphate pyrophosphorylase [Thermoanaerobacteraceae bacterium]|uniref:Thiamine-phosphate synthase n=1 Tax=Biomaibacter acetigenes TaxID=2316383 RepID=A0A3G2R2N2_9FIRM|nr:thiamine phosphate synthase [Biomaibacter acetigenes]AYO29756.1 thiamine phosphate synthase [Biomaibacter acetigenes]MDK2878848.1 thiamine-phosphate pyrophosphorylase [Thermoanaerobacteraceae bacterium]RKL61810.1 thiamine phosphate synthase [Thermoanaerobacteraceae bacterium SP2]